MLVRPLIVSLAVIASASLLAQPPQPDWPRLEEETLQHFQALLRLDTRNPPGNEKLAVDYLKQALDREGIPALRGLARTAIRNGFWRASSTASSASNGTSSPNWRDRDDIIG